MRLLTFTTSLTLFANASALPGEIHVPHWEASSRIEGARFVAGEEIVVVTIEKSEFDQKMHDGRVKGWGWNTRIELDRDLGENERLVSLSITVDGTSFVVPKDHLHDLYNPSSNRASVTRDADTNALQVTITGGHTPNIYDVTFCFEHGKYVRREFVYVESDPKRGKRDANKIEHFPNEGEASAH